jgi:hypothetical protein
LNASDEFFYIVGGLVQPLIFRGIREKRVDLGNVRQIIVIYEIADFEVIRIF